MITEEQIVNSLLVAGGELSRRELVSRCGVAGLDLATMDTTLGRLVRQGVLRKTGRGVYALPEERMQAFVYKPSEEEQELSRRIRGQFPQLLHCVWSPRCLVPFMQHVPDLTMTLVDVEMREGAESVFHYLQDAMPERKILLRPTREECDRYLYQKDVIVVRTLIGQSPLVRVNDVQVPSLEKILVDTMKDPELHFAGGAELYRIFENVEDSYGWNLSRMMRYAARRNRTEELKRILQTIADERQNGHPADRPVHQPTRSRAE